MCFPLWANLPQTPVIKAPTSRGGGENHTSLSKNPAKFLGSSVSLSPSIIRQDRTNGTLKLKISKLAETTGLPWSKMLPLALLTVCNTPFGKHKLTPHEIVTGRQMSLGIQ